MDFSKFRLLPLSIHKKSMKGTSLVVQWLRIHLSINKDLEELKNKHTQTNNTITEVKNTLEGINRRISEAEE